MRQYLFPGFTLVAVAAILVIAGGVYAMAAVMLDTMAP